MGLKLTKCYRDVLIAIYKESKNSKPNYSQVFDYHDSNIDCKMFEYICHSLHQRGLISLVEENGLLEAIANVKITSFGKKLAESFL